MAVSAGVTDTDIVGRRARLNHYLCATLRPGFTNTYAQSRATHLSTSSRPSLIVSATRSRIYR